MSETPSSALMGSRAATPFAISPSPPSRLGQLVVADLTSLVVRDEPLLSHLPSVAAAHALALGVPKSVPSHHMRCRMTAILLPTATRAFFQPARLAIFKPHALS